MKCSICQQETESPIGGNGDILCEWCNAVSIRERENSQDRRKREPQRWYDYNRGYAMLGWSFLYAVAIFGGVFLGWLLRGYCG